jgi:hypothetical protein
MDITFEGNRLVAIPGHKSGPERGAPFAKTGLSEPVQQVKEMFVAVPQIEHNWTANRRPTPQT